jgi:stress-induced morphogen
MKERVALHMLESGVAKVDDEYLDLGNNEKIDYIKETFGDTTDTGIMCHFVGERLKLEKEFKNAQIYSSSSHAEGVDLSHLKNFVILSSDYSGAKFVQRRERIINILGSATLTVHHILVKGAISEQVYRRVSKKEDFNNSTYEGRSL